MQEIQILWGNNKILLNAVCRSADFIYSDPIYESLDFEFANICYDKLTVDGVFALQTDLSTVAEWKIYLDNLYGKKNNINLISVQFDWGGRSNRKFPHKTDYILIYSKSQDYKFHWERILIPKKTAGTNLDKKGTGLKIPTDFWDDMSFSTLAKERVKKEGHNVHWQKSQKLLNRLVLPFTDEEDFVVDTHMGVGSLGKWCKENNRDYCGIELEKEIYDLAKENIWNQKAPSLC